MFADDELDLSLDTMFSEPPRPSTPKPTVAIYNRDDGNICPGNDWKDIKIRLVGNHPLWGHYLWNASRSFASYLDEHRDLYEGRDVLELGAGGALPSLVVAKNGARKVVITDYPDSTLIENLEYNVQSNLSIEEQASVVVMGYIWGQSQIPLLGPIPPSLSKNGFDLIILSDLIFNHSQHDALLSTCENVLMKDPWNTFSPSVLVFYSHHRPHLAHRDMEFFSKAQKRDWRCEKMVEEKFPPMFPEDSGDETVRATVHGWKLTRMDREHV